MVDELARVKNYLRLDSDITEDDDQLNALIAAAKRYITTNTGKAFVKTDEVMELCMTMLVTHWYTDRSPLTKSNTQEYPHSLTAILKHIEISSAYPEVKHDDPESGTTE